MAYLPVETRSYIKINYLKGVRIKCDGCGVITEFYLMDHELDDIKCNICGMQMPDYYRDFLKCLKNTHLHHNTCHEVRSLSIEFEIPLARDLGVK